MLQHIFNVVSIIGFGTYFLTADTRKVKYLVKSIKTMCSGEQIELSEIKLKSAIETNDSMHKEDHTGDVWQLNGDLGNVVRAKDGRVGKVILTVDFRETADVLTAKEYGS